MRSREAGAQPAFPPSVVVEIKRVACGLPMDAGVPLARWSLTDLRREVLARGLVATINNGTGLPTVALLVQGLKLPVYGADGSYSGDRFSNNPAWILLDILRRAGWSLPEIDVASFASAARNATASPSDA